MREVVLIFILVSIAQLFYGQEKYTIQGRITPIIRWIIVICV